MRHYSSSLLCIFVLLSLYAGNFLGSYKSAHVIQQQCANSLLELLSLLLYFVRKREKKKRTRKTKPLPFRNATLGLSVGNFSKCNPVGNKLTIVTTSGVYDVINGNVQNTSQTPPFFFWTRKMHILYTSGRENDSLKYTIFCSFCVACRN